MRLKCSFEVEIGASAITLVIALVHWLGTRM